MKYGTALLITKKKKIKKPSLKQSTSNNKKVEMFYKNIVTQWHKLSYKINLPYISSLISSVLKHEIQWQFIYAVWQYMNSAKLNKDKLIF